MDPFTLSLIAASGGGLLSLLGGRKEIDFSKLEEMFGTGALGKRSQDLFAMLASSPAFRTAIGNTNIAGQQLGQNINQNLARSGLDTSGMGAVASGLGGAASGFGVQNLIGNLHSTALEKGSDLNSLLANLFLGTRQQGPTPMQNLGGSLLGAAGPGLLKGPGQGSTFGRPAGANNSGFNAWGSPAMKEWWK